MLPESYVLDDFRQEEQNMFSNNVLGLTEAEIMDDIEDVLSNMQFEELEEIELLFQRLGSGYE